VPRAKIEPGRYRNMTGNTALALGIVAAGVQMQRPIFLGAYPITPASDVLHELSRYRHFGVKTFQAEDEIAAISAAIGASFAGSLGVCTTSGPGFVLKQEALNLAVVAELPLVVVDIQRAGPSTGMPTRTQQADVLTCAYASHGDTRHVLLFPEDPHESFEFAASAFDLAERLQTPIFVMLDLDIGMNERLTAPLDWDPARSYDRGKVMSYQELESGKEFGRYLDTDGDGIAYRTYPGTHPTRGAFFTRGTTKDRYAKYSEAGTDYVENMQRLLRKFETAKGMLPQPVVRPALQPTRLGVVYYGSTSPAMEEALDTLEQQGLHFDALRIRAFPFHEQVADFIAEHDQVFVVEQNRDAQMRMLIVNECGVDPARLTPVLHYDGTPITARFIIKELAEDVAALKVTPMRKVVP